MVLKLLGWWKPETEQEKWYAEGWINGVITAIILFVLISAGLFLLAFER